MISSSVVNNFSSLYLCNDCSLQLNGISTSENQYEVFFDKGSRFKFVSVDEDDGKYIGNKL